jgi:hypothetical protein
MPFVVTIFFLVYDPTEGVFVVFSSNLFYVTTHRVHYFQHSESAPLTQIKGFCYLAKKKLQNRSCIAGEIYHRLLIEKVSHNSEERVILCLYLSRSLCHISY